MFLNLLWKRQNLLWKRLRNIAVKTTCGPPSKYPRCTKGGLQVGILCPPTSNMLWKRTIHCHVRPSCAKHKRVPAKPDAFPQQISCLDSRNHDAPPPLKTIQYFEGGLHVFTAMFSQQISSFSQQIMTFSQGGNTSAKPILTVLWSRNILWRFGSPVAMFFYPP